MKLLFFLIACTFTLASCESRYAQYTKQATTVGINENQAQNFEASLAFNKSVGDKPPHTQCGKYHRKKYE